MCVHSTEMEDNLLQMQEGGIDHRQEKEGIHDVIKEMTITEDTIKAIRHNYFQVYIYV